ncbi:hypothetical protein ACFLZH_03870 [Patescibacteria group bacterium]
MEKGSRSTSYEPYYYHLEWDIEVREVVDKQGRLVEKLIAPKEPFEETEVVNDIKIHAFWDQELFCYAISFQDMNGASNEALYTDVSYKSHDLRQVLKKAKELAMHCESAAELHEKIDEFALSIVKNSS